MQNIRRALVCAVVAAAALVGCSALAAEPSPTYIVTHFNDGFRDAKQDDCEQGFKPACDWLDNNH
jgi:hypothetical protein